MREIKASEFKAKCLALIDEVSTTGEPLAITKRGQIVAKLVPQAAIGQQLFGRGRDTIRIVDAEDDLINILGNEESAGWSRGDVLIDSQGNNPSIGPQSEPRDPRPANSNATSVKKRR